MLAAGPLTDSVGARWVWGGCAALLGLTAALAWALCRRLPQARAAVEPLTAEPGPPVAESAAG
jgi:hypothetical protein